VCYLDFLPKEATNKHQGSRKVRPTNFWMDDDGENCRSNGWHYEDNYMLLKDTWQNRRFHSERESNQCEEWLD
jgi:hypothetical protein